MLLKFKLSKNEKVFSLLYFFTILTLLLDQVDGIPFTGTLRKFKYVYIALMVLYVIATVICENGVIRWRFSTASLVLALLFTHTILFGYIFTNEIVEDSTNYHAMQMLIFLVMVAVTAFFIKKNNCFILFVFLSYVACVLTLVIAMLTHTGDGFNFIWGVFNAFTGETGRHKALYGFVHGGYVSYHSFVTLALSMFLFERLRKSNIKPKKRRLACLVLVICDLIPFVALTMSGERSGIISFAILILSYVFFEHITKHRLVYSLRFWIPFTIVVVIIIVMLSLTGVFEYIWENSSRELNFSVNYPVFLELGNFATGMGYVENSGFNTSLLVYGVQTSSLDIYYLYIFFTTGIIGSILIGTVLIALFVSFFRNMKNKHGELSMALYCSMLFFAFWQCNFMTYRFQPCFILTVVIICMAQRRKNSIKELRE